MLSAQWVFNECYVCILLPGNNNYVFSIRNLLVWFCFPESDDVEVGGISAWFLFMHNPSERFSLNSVFQSLTLSSPWKRKSLYWTREKLVLDKIFFKKSIHEIDCKGKFITNEIIVRITMIFLIPYDSMSWATAFQNSLKYIDVILLIDI